jgi:hypothetical protein
MGQFSQPCGCCNPCPCTCPLTCDPQLPTDGAGGKGGVLFGHDSVQNQGSALPIAREERVECPWCGWKGKVKEAITKERALVRCPMCHEAVERIRRVED